MEHQDLLDLKEKIDQAKEKSAELKGQLKGLTKELSDDWGCTTIEQAERKVTKMESDIEKLNTQINEGVEELEEKYNVEN